MSEMILKNDLDLSAIEYFEENDYSISVLHYFFSFLNKKKQSSLKGCIVEYDDLAKYCACFCTSRVLDATINMLCSHGIISVENKMQIVNEESFSANLKFDLYKYKQWIACIQSKRVTMADVLDLFVDEGFPTNELNVTSLEVINEMIDEGISLNQLSSAIKYVLLNTEQTELNKFNIVVKRARLAPN